MNSYSDLTEEMTKTIVIPILINSSAAWQKKQTSIASS